MDFLKELGLKDINPGTCTGFGEWSNDESAGLIESYNPATGELLGKVYSASDADYEKVLKTAQAAAEKQKSPRSLKYELFLTGRRKTKTNPGSKKNRGRWR